MTVPLDEMVGCLAGLICLGSSIPQIRLMMAGNIDRASHSLLRGAMMVVGNSLWAVFAAMNENIAPIVMCSIGVLMNLWICALLIWPKDD